MALTILIAGFLLVFWWVYKCFVKKMEGKHKIIRSLGGRRVRGISGVTGLVVDNDGKLTQGDNKGDFDFIIYGLQFVDEYNFEWGEARPSNQMASDPKGKIIHGDIQNDPEVLIQRNEHTVFHLHQHDYRFLVKNMETGEERQQTPGATAQKPENIKIDATLNSTIVMRNIFQARYQAGGKADWYRSIVATITGTLGEAVIDLKYGQLNKIRGEKLQDIPVKNTEPLHGSKMYDAEGRPIMENGIQKLYAAIFVDDQGNQREKISFLERINYEVLVIKKLGVELLNITLLDYEPDEESKPYMKALRKNAIAAVEVDTSEKEGTATQNRMRPKVLASQVLIRELAQQEMNIKETPDVTKIAESENQPNLRVKVYGGGEGGNSLMAKADDIVKTALGMTVAEEINDESDDDNKKKKVVKNKEVKNEAKKPT